jgi:hypothetical protein
MVLDCDLPIHASNTAKEIPAKEFIFNHEPIHRQGIKIFSVIFLAIFFEIFSAIFQRSHIFAVVRPEPPLH